MHSIILGVALVRCVGWWSVRGKDAVLRWDMVRCVGGRVRWLGVALGRCWGVDRGGVALCGGVLVAWRGSVVRGWG